MSSAINNNLPPQSDSSKASSKKKRGKNEASVNGSVSTPTPSNPDLDTVKPESVVNGVNGVTDDLESSFFKDLHRNLRNATKKLNATAKVDSIIAEYPGKSLDLLVAEKKINADQRAQVLKKPALQAQVAQIEEQINQYKQFAAHYEERLVSQKTALEKTHKEELEAARENAVAELKGSQDKTVREQLLILSQFLRAAASFRRAGDGAAVDSQAFEGVLLQVYGGNQDAVESMLKLIGGSEEKVTGIDGQVLDATYARVKELSEEQAPPAPVEEPSAAETDPTIANAGLTELQDAPVSATADASTFGSEGQPVQATEPVLAPTQTAAGDGANSLAASWEPQTSGSIAASGDEWVEVPSNPTEGESPSTTAAAQPSTSWAEDVPTGAAPTERGDGFEQVVHHQRQNSVRGGGRGGRGRGRGDGSRGRGGRGEFRGRGRGRGEFKGGRGRGGLGGGPQVARREAVATN